MSNGMRCAVSSCKNTSAKNSAHPTDYHIYFHRFPKDETIARMWIDRCNRNSEINVRNARMCSEHFTEDDYQRDLQHELLGLPIRRRLHSKAIPTLKLPGEDMETCSVDPLDTETDLRLRYEELMEKYEAVTQENKELKKLLQQNNQLLNKYKNKMKKIENCAV